MGTKNMNLLERGLRFNVSGLSFKGVVEITLNGSDLYDIKFFKPVRKQNQVMKDLGIKRFDTTLEEQKHLGFLDVFVEDLMHNLEIIVENKQ